MFRKLYLATLLALQFGLLLRVGPALGDALGRDAALGAIPGGWFAVLHYASAAGAVFGAAVALTFPALALLRHRQRGDPRFRGMPRWAVGMALTGGGVLATALFVGSALPGLAPDARWTAILVERPALDAGLALMAAGTLCAELLRRSVGLQFAAPGPRRTLADLIEVTHPRDLSTRAV